MGAVTHRLNLFMRECRRKEASFPWISSGATITKAGPPLPRPLQLFFELRGSVLDLAKVSVLGSPPPLVSSPTLTDAGQPP